MNDITRLIRQLEIASSGAKSASFLAGRGHNFAALLTLETVGKALASACHALDSLTSFLGDLPSYVPCQEEE